MISSVLELQGAFTRDQYPPDPQTNLSVVPIEDIQGYLNQTFPEGYEYKVVAAGSLADGSNFVTINLTVNMESGKHTVAGGASGRIGIAGLIMIALRNAVLRGLGAGTELYQYEEGQEPHFADNSPAQSQPAQTYSQPYTQQGNTGGTYNNGGGYNGGAAKPNYGPWTGVGKNGQPITIKSGNLAGQAWIHLDEQVLMGMAQKGNNMAIMELERRNGNSGPSNSNSNFPPNAFARR